MNTVSYTPFLGSCDRGITVSEVHPMTTERQRQQAEDRRERAEEGRRHTEKQRDVDEHKRQTAEKEREVRELVRDSERAGERLIIEYSTHGGCFTGVDAIGETLPKTRTISHTIHTCETPSSKDHTSRGINEMDP